MSYCDDCILLDICGKEGCCDEAMTFCADKNKFIHVSTLDKIRAEIEELDRYYDNDYFSTNTCPMYKCNEVLQIIDKYRKEQTEE